MKLNSALQLQKHIKFVLYALLFLSPFHSSFAQTETLQGNVYDMKNKQPVSGATINLPQSGQWAVSDENGNFIIKKVPSGNTRIEISCIGYISQEKNLDRITGKTVKIFLEEANLRLKEIEVTAKEKKEGATPVTSISRAAIDHIQAVSLGDILNLLPGAVPSNQNLASPSTANIHNFTDANTYSGASIQDGSAMNSMGTSIIVDNAPLTNNSNLQILNQAAAGNTAGFTSNAGNGVDLRQITADNIESVDIIKGIPSAQYGEVSSGAVIVHSKAGKSPLQIRFKINPNITQTSATGGWSLGKKSSILNVGMDYAHSTNDQRDAGDSYGRYTSKLLYSNTFFDKLRANLSLDLFYNIDNAKQDPDDQISGQKSKSEEKGFRFNANGYLQINTDWIRALHYTLSTEYTDADSYFQRSTSTGENIRSTALSDGTTVSSQAGESITDADGNLLTHISGNDTQAYAYYNPNSYIYKYSVNGKEWNTFASLRSIFAHEFGISKHKFSIGADYRSDGNRGEGKTFLPESAPTSSNNSSLRPRSFKDIPFIQQIGAYAEENLILEMGKRNFEVQAGVRYDKQKEIQSELTPRINASMEILPKKLFIRGGYGEMVKSVPLLYMYPETAYFDLVNYTNMATSSLGNYQYLVTTRAFDTRNYDIKMAKNKKYEIGFDLQLGKKSLSVTAYHERMKNGYAYFDWYSPVLFNQYVDNGNGLVLNSAASQNIYLSYNKPGNILDTESRGIDFELNLGRFDPVRTAVILTGGYVENYTSYNDYSYYIYNGNTSSRYVGIYAPYSDKYKRQRFATTLNIVHNIPELGFVVSLSAVTTWMNTYQKMKTNDSIPVSYLSISDNQIHDFDPSQANNSEFSSIVKSKTLNAYRFERESLPVLWCFNLNLTKEIGRYLNVSFFANNLFSYNPRYRKRHSDTYTILNPDSFFGLELAAKIPW